MTDQEKETEAIIEIVHGIPDDMRVAAAALYEEAFGSKFAVAIPLPKVRRALIRDSLMLSHALGAVVKGQLVGLAGYKSGGGCFTGGMNFRMLLKHAGILRGIWAAMVFSLYERSRTPGQLLMDGIVVDASMRGLGIGSRLLHELCQFASKENYQSVRLDVIDTNPGARRMYERNGFVVTQTEKFEFLRWFFGFGASSTMVHDLENAKK